MKSLEDATMAFYEEKGRDPRTWEIIPVNLEGKVVEAQQVLAQGGDLSNLGWMLSKAIYEAGGDFDAQGLVMNEKLGIESHENLDDVVKRTVADLLKIPADDKHLI